MNNLDSILLEGNLVADPGLRYTPNGAPVCSFCVACNRYFKQDRWEDPEGKPPPESSRDHAKLLLRGGARQMAAIAVMNIPEKVITLIKNQARRNKRSVEQKIRTILSEVVLDWEREKGDLLT
jgi:hypothetical protein